MGQGKAARPILWLLPCALTVGLLGLLFLVDVDALSTALQYPQQPIRFRANSPYGKLVVTESAGQFNFIFNGLPVTSTHDFQQVEETVHYAMAQRPDARQVLLVGGGVSGTARELLKYAMGEVTYVELDPLFIKAGRRFLPEALADRRIQVVNTDGRLFIKRTEQRFDVVIVDVPDPSTSQLNRFYTTEFFAEVKRVLTKEGVLSFSLGHYENFVSRELGRMLASAHATLETAFAQVRMIPGGRVFFLASDGPLHDDIAARLEAKQIPTRFVKRQYLDAMLTPDRLADLQRATSPAAAVNRDFNPVLYFYHLVHWMSQFKLRFGLLEVALGLLLLVYLLRLRAVPLAIFASGFAASALEVVLLLGFQVLYGSLYQQMAILVTLFMAGLAIGAFLMNRLEHKPGRRSLGTLALALAGFAALLPLMLRGLGRLDNAGAFPLLLPAYIPLLTLLLGLLVGLEFPLANVIEFQGSAATASHIYTADFVGACLGALLASTLLIPLLGVTATCLLTAGLNIIGGLAVLLRKAGP